MAHEDAWVLDGPEAPTQPNGAEKAHPGEAPNNREHEALELKEPSDVERIAEELGWKPEHKWHGDKAGWTTAEQYLRSTAARQRSSAQKAAELKASNEEYQLRLERLERATNQMMSEQEQRHRAELEAYYERAKREAARAGDDDLYEHLIEEKRVAEAELDRQFTREPEVNYQQQAQEMLNDPVVGKFLKEHSWVVADDEIYNFAFSVAQDYADAGYPKSMQIRAVKEALREEYPEHFEAKSRSRSAPPRVAQEDGDGQFNDESPRRDAPPQDPETGRFVPRRDAHLYEQSPQQVARRAPPHMQAGSRMPSNGRGAEQQAWNSLPPEARSVFKQQKQAGSFKGDIVRFAKIYHGESINAIDD